MWTALATLARLLLLGRLRPQLVVGGKAATLDLVHGRVALIALLDGLGTDLASFVAIVGPAAIVAALLARAVPRAARAASAIVIAPVCLLAIAVMLNLLAFVHSAQPIDFTMLGMLHDARDATDFLAREAGGGIALAAILGAVGAVPAIAFVALGRLVVPPARGTAIGVGVLVALAIGFVFRVGQLGGPGAIAEERLVRLSVRQYEDPTWRLGLGIAWRRSAGGREACDLDDGEQAALRATLTPGDDTPALDPRYPLFRRWSPSGERVVDVPPPARPANVVLVFLESNGAADTGAIGGGADTPRLDALAAGGLLFPSFYSNGTYSEAGFYGTLASMYSFSASAARRPGAPPPSGLLASMTSDFAALSPPDSTFDCRRGTLTDVLERHGWHGAFVVGRDTTWPVLRNVSCGLEARLVPGSSRGWGDDRALFDEALRWAKDAPRPYLLTVFTATHHAPWTVPDPTFEGGKVPADEYERSRQALRYQDQAIGAFVDAMRALPDFADTLFVFLGDHGPHLRPGGTTMLAGLGDAAIHVPLVIWQPGRVPARRLDEPGSQVDVAPTVLDLLGISDAETSFVGRSLLRGGDGSVFATAALGPVKVGLIRDGLEVVWGPTLSSARVFRLGGDEPLGLLDDGHADRANAMLRLAWAIDRDACALLRHRTVAPPGEPAPR